MIMQLQYCGVFLIIVLPEKETQNYNINFFKKILKILFVGLFVEVCLKVHTTSVMKVNDALSKALKHMPKKKGGPLFRVRLHHILTIFCTFLLMHTLRIHL